MSVFAIALVATVGLAIDVGRIFIAKSETQVFCDAAALAAATRLNGTSSGINSAASAVTATANAWNLDSQTGTGYTLEYATSTTGTWTSNPANPAGYVYARVRLPVQLPLFFIPVVANKYTQQVESLSAAGQVSISSFSVGLEPYTLVGINTTGPNFGLTAGTPYTIQWPQFNGTRSGCSNANPDKCFNSSPCSGDPKSVKWDVAHNWGSSTNGYWGFSSNADIERAIINGLQTQSIYVGQNLLPIMTNGNKAAQQKILDERTNQDADRTSSSITNYQGSTLHNGRRIMLIPVVNPVDTNTTTVLGFAAVLLYSNAESNSNSSDYYDKNTNGNDPFCAIYMGPYVVGSPNAGGATTGSGAYRPRLAL